MNSIQAQAVYDAGMFRVRATPVPKGQRFPPGTRVRIAAKLPDYMSHFPADRDATVQYTYAHAFRGSDVKSYSLDVDGIGSVAWYDEDQLTEL